MRGCSASVTLEGQAVTMIRNALVSLLFLLTATAADAVCRRSGHTSGTDPASLSRAEDILKSNGVAVGKEYRVTRLVPYESGAGMIWVQRLIGDLPVFWDELALHFDAQGRVKRDKSGKPFVGGDAETLPRSDVDLTPKISSEAAKKAFAERARVIEMEDLAGRPIGTQPGPDYRERLHELDTELGIYKGELAWQICPPDGLSGYVSAADGRVIYFDSGIRS